MANIQCGVNMHKLYNGSKRQSMEAKRQSMEAQRQSMEAFRERTQPLLDAVSDEEQNRGGPLDDPEPAAEGVPPSSSLYQKNVGLAQIFKEFWLIGWTAVGGPASHIGMFEKVRGTSLA